MNLRPAAKKDMPDIYRMGFDVWGELSSMSAYLDACENSEKYKLGKWFCLEDNKLLLSSLIIYRDCLGLDKGYCGLGSIATVPELRKNGFATRLIEQCIQSLRQEGVTGVYLFSDITPSFYEKLGFIGVQGHTEQGLMYLGISGEGAREVPSYF